MAELQLGFRDPVTGAIVPQVADLNSLPTILNGPAALGGTDNGTPKPSLDDRANALLKRLEQGGLSQSGQYYTPMPQLRQDLNQVLAAKSAESERVKADAANMATPQKLYDQAMIQFHLNNPDATDTKTAAFSGKLRSSLNFPAPATPASPTPTTPPPVDVEGAFNRAREQVEIDPKTLVPKTRPTPSGKGIELVKGSKTPGEAIMELERAEPGYVERNWSKLFPLLKDEEKGYGSKFMDQWMQTTDHPRWPGDKPSDDELARELLMNLAGKNNSAMQQKLKVFGVQTNLQPEWLKSPGFQILPDLRYKLPDQSKPLEPARGLWEWITR